MTAYDRLSRICGPQVPPELTAAIDELVAEVRAERDTEIIAWLIKKAREYSSIPARQESAADAIARMADKISRGAVRPAIAPSPAPVNTTDETVEYGVRSPLGDVLAPCVGRSTAEARLERCRSSWPTAALMQRTVRYGAWTEVER